MTEKKLKAITGEVVPKFRNDKIEKYVSQIKPAWNRLLASIFEVGDLLADAKDNLDGKEYKELLTRLGFGTRTEERLIAIARDSRLRAKRIQAKLPACWTTLYVLSEFNDQQWRSLQDSNKLTPKLTRAAAENFKKGIPNKPSTSKSLPVTVSPEVQKSGANGNTAFHIFYPNGFNDKKGRLDARFLRDVLLRIFQNAYGNDKPSVEDGNNIRLSPVGTANYNYLAQLIEQIKKVENTNRRKLGDALLNDFEQTLSLLGVDPDSTKSGGFCLMEKIILAYAKRQGISGLKIDWFKARRDSEPEIKAGVIDRLKAKIAAKI